MKAVGYLLSAFGMALKTIQTIKNIIFQLTLNKKLPAEINQRVVSINSVGAS
jgi:hypothetical protein